MANIKQQKKRVGIQERQRTENLRYRSTIKTLTKRLEAAVAERRAPRARADDRSRLGARRAPPQYRGSQEVARRAARRERFLAPVPRSHIPAQRLPR